MFPRIEKIGSFTFLKEYPSLFEGLVDLLSCSRQRVKKSNLPNSLLNKRVNSKTTFDLPIDLLNYGEISPVYEGDEVKIIDENEFFLAIDKPVKIHTHPHSYSEKNNLLSFLRSSGRYDLLSINQLAYDRGALYRLDFETSGVLLFSKSEEVYNEVRHDFSKLVKEKYYLVVTSNLWDKKDGDYSFYFHSFGAKGERVIARESDGEFGTLSIEHLASHEGRSLLLVNLKTGLRHQIRATLVALGHPILGDHFYGGDKYERMMLHAFSYQINFSENTYRFKTEYPESFKLLFNFESHKMGHHLFRSNFINKK